jgi:hypothetical protein
MDTMTLLTEACAAGLTIKADEGTLVVRRPRAAEPLARQLLAHKAEVLRHLTPRVAVQVWSDALEAHLWVLADGEPIEAYPQARIMLRTEVAPGVIVWV